MGVVEHASPPESATTHTPSNHSTTIPELKHAEKAMGLDAGWKRAPIARDEQFEYIAPDPGELPILTPSRSHMRVSDLVIPSKTPEE